MTHSADATPTPGARGQTRSTWRHDTNLRGLLIRLLRKHPEADPRLHPEITALPEYVLDSYLTTARRRADLVDEALSRAADNDFLRLRQSVPNNRPTLQTGEASETLSRIKLAALDFILSNGKKLGDCTGRELRDDLIQRAQDTKWLRAIAKLVPDDQIVRDIVNEKQAYTLRTAANTKG
jgi:hypothetical protein